MNTKLYNKGGSEERENSMKKISELEFICLMASLMALSALSIDAILPALNEIGNTIGIIDSKENQLLITMIFLGLGFGQLFSGTLSDSLGRKPVVYIGYFIFSVASIICVFSTSLEMMIVGRLLQGFGLSAPKSVSMAIIRDRFKGNSMAKIMSFVTAIFILAPVVAPSLGKVILDQFGWRAIFYSQLLFGFTVLAWFWQRQEETLHPDNKRVVNLYLFTEGTKAFLKQRTAVLYTCIIGIFIGPFLAYISTSQQIFEVQYNLKEYFPYIFSGLALVIGFATYLNGRFVLKIGMLRLTIISLITIILVSIMYIGLNFNENPSSTLLIIFFGMLLFPSGFVIGNIHALAMEPLGHIAGIGAAIIGFLSTLISVPIATFIGIYMKESPWPLFIGFAICSVVSLMLMLLNRHFNVTRNVRIIA